MTDHYATLGVPRGAALDDIKQAHRKLSRAHHPDTAKSGHTCKKKLKDGEKKALCKGCARFQEIQEAYATLSDPDRRMVYDTSDPMSTANKVWEHFTKKTTPNPDWADSVRYASSFRWKPYATNEKRGDHIHIPLEISFEEMCSGCVKDFTVIRRVKCPKCDGAGGENLEDCKFCEGKGRPNSFLTHECELCRGKGKMPRTTCVTCAGSGLAPKEQTIKLTLPAGIQPEQTTTLEGYGQEILDGVAGDLIVRIRVRRHDLFNREGLNITCALKVNALRAILGGDVVIQTIHGDRTVHIPPGVQNGNTLILEGEGIHTKKGKGNQNIHIRIFVPTLDSEKERGALTKILGDDTTEAEIEPIGEYRIW